MAKGLASLLLASLVCAPLTAGWRAGVGRVDITPSEAVWLGGYAARKKPSEGVAGPIMVKALALEDHRGGRLLAITCDLLTMPRRVAEPVAKRISLRYALPRSRILLCASHSHSAPVIDDQLLDMYFLDEARLGQVARYTLRVKEALFRAACDALDSLSPAEIRAGSGFAGFARNRRRVNPDDPVDHEVPVLLAEFGEPSGDRDAGARQKRQRAVLFAYACHNTTLNGLQVCGDYAGFAQEELERRHAGLTALFASGCGADQNPIPRRTMELARKYGKELADAVTRVLRSPMREVRGTTGAAFGWQALPLVPRPGRSELQEQLRSDNRYVQSRARRLLEKLDSGEGIPASYEYPAQVWRLGPNLFIVSLAGEVVVDYALRLKKDVLEAISGEGRVMVLAYANDCPGYIPSERVLREGGYEGGGAMLYYQLHGTWAEGVEERVVSQVLELARKTLPPGATTADGALPSAADGGEPDFATAETILRRAVEERAFPGCVVAVGTSRRALWQRGFGRLDYDGGAAAGPTTLYDLASLTKVVGTTSVVMALVRDGKLSLKDPVVKYVPEFAAGGQRSGKRREVRVEHLLTHSSGLPAWKPYYRSIRSYDELLAAVLAEPLEAEPGSRCAYSDLGFILLGETAARAGAEPLDVLERRLVFDPLGSKDILRRPPDDEKRRIAPTELLSEEGDFVHGVVHDENCRAAGGITGHAGLFGTARDLSRFSAEMLRSLDGRGALFPRELARDFVRRRGLVHGSSRALGWDTPSEESSAGTVLSKRSFGHTGFTGTSLWIDPERDLYVILLSNRVHPGRKNQKIRKVRRALADAVAEAFDASGGTVRRPPGRVEGDRSAPAGVRER